MIEIVFASAIYAAAFQNAAADGARSALRTCIRAATEEARGQKIGNDAFPGFVRSKCTAQESSFKSAVWAFDSKNKVSRRQSEDDANLQVEDFVGMAAEKYAGDAAPQ